jgi:hypothetical protein
VSVSAPPAAGTDPAAATALLQNNVASGALSAEMTRRGLAADVGAAGAFLRPSPELRSLNPFEQYRGDGVAAPGAPPAPSSGIMELRGGSDTSFLLSIVAICVAGAAFCAAAGALLRVAMLGRPSAAQIPRMGDIEAQQGKGGGMRSSSGGDRDPRRGGSGDRKSMSRQQSTSAGARGSRERDARYNKESKAPLC